MERFTGRAIILSGGEPLESIKTIEVPDHDFVIAADSGLRHARVLGLEADLIIGDMDSVEPSKLADAAARGSTIERYPTDKDRTDLELAVHAAIDRGARNITIIGAHTGRLDHLLGAIGLFASIAPKLDHLVWVDGITDVMACSPDRTTTIAGRAGDLVSLLPTGSDVRGVTTGGLHWQLADETLPAGSTRGLSNTIETPPAWVRVDDGTLLVLHERKLP